MVGVREKNAMHVSERKLQWKPFGNSFVISEQQLGHDKNSLQVSLWGPLNNNVNRSQDAPCVPPLSRPKSLRAFYRQYFVK